MATNPISGTYEAAIDLTQQVGRAEGLSERSIELLLWALRIFETNSGNLDPEAEALEAKEQDKLRALVDAQRPGYQASSRSTKVAKDVRSILLLQGAADEIDRLQASDAEPEAVAKDMQSLRDQLSNMSFGSGAGGELYEAQRQALRRLLRDEIAQRNGGEPAAGFIDTKAAQVLFRTALRNHIDLTSIADNKANIMLSNNALIATLGAPWLFRAVSADSRLLLPSVLLLATTISSALLATLVTRPVKLGPGAPPEGKRLVNPFFFGNFYSLSLDRYGDELNALTRDGKRLERAAVVDMYFLGKALGSKYIRLRWCYNVFMIGMTTSLAALAGMMIFG